jgi:LysM repeat protein
MAIAGALVASPQAQHAAGLAGAAKSDVVAISAAKPHHAAVAAPAATLETVNVYAAKSAARASPDHASRSYTVRAGDTLSGIAQAFYRDANDWPWLYDRNDTTISDPNLIYVGQVIEVPYNPPAGGGGSSGRAGASVLAETHDSSSGAGSTSLSGNLDCSGLEQLWDSAGGNPDDAFMAAEIAMAESSGDQYALGPTDDYGYWQINASHGSLATLDAYGNARSAIILSDDGTNWTPWVTYNTGAYIGKC